MRHPLLCGMQSVRERPFSAEDPSPALGGYQNDELVSRPPMAALPPYEAQQQFASAGTHGMQPSAPPMPGLRVQPVSLPAGPAPDGAVAGGKMMNRAQL